MNMSDVSHPRGKRCSEDRPAVDIVEGLNLFKILRERMRPDDLESKTRLIFHMLSQQPMSELPCDSNVSTFYLLSQKPLLFPSKDMRSLDSLVSVIKITLCCYFFF